MTKDHKKRLWYVYYNGQKCVVSQDLGEDSYNIHPVNDPANMYLCVHKNRFEEYHEQRMYFFVQYSLSGIQKGIQAGHAAMEYARRNAGKIDFRKFAERDKTFILLDGGTSNAGVIDMYGTGIDTGSMEDLLAELDSISKDSRGLFNYAAFWEPDLNWTLTSLSFLADDMVYDFKKYPEFIEWLRSKHVSESYIDMYKAMRISETRAPWPEVDQMPSDFKAYVDEWTQTLGGEINVRLRNLIRGKRLA